jgi:hypothetical protein
MIPRKFLHGASLVICSCGFLLFYRSRNDAKEALVQPEIILQNERPVISEKTKLKHSSIPGEFWIEVRKSISAR